MLDDERLPSATVEEMFSPDEIVAVNTPDGGIRLLMYCGPRRDGGFLLLKHAVLRPSHASSLIKGVGPDDRWSEGQGVAPSAGAGASWRDAVSDVVVPIPGTSAGPDGQGAWPTWPSLSVR